ncbi:hypothetical protein [Vandammella animalimorsus]|uniref:hypothetical protein n=1 Tax=Vandammella animalimorsus TaxID=2029117 RepID=UPI0011776F5F|nr:hypothetical protein [Vandammella animalimorsus]
MPPSSTGYAPLQRRHRADRRAKRRQNLAAADWTLSAEHMAQLDAASFRMPPYPYYPYWNGQFAELNPPPVAGAV